MVANIFFIIAAMIYIAYKLIAEAPKGAVKEAVSLFGIFLIFFIAMRVAQALESPILVILVMVVGFPLYIWAIKKVPSYKDNLNVNEDPPAPAEKEKDEEWKKFMDRID